MSFAPLSLIALEDYWKGRKGIALGIVGDPRHSYGYHLGVDRLKPGDYSRQRPRDRAGLSNAASAIDLGRLEGDLKHLQRFSDWLARRCVKGASGTGDIVEIIYSPDGAHVYGYKQGVAYLIPDYGDATHLSHTHISYFRDSEKRDKIATFRPYFELPDTSTGGDPMTIITVLPFGGIYTIPAGAAVTGYAMKKDGSIDTSKPKTWTAHPSASQASYDATMFTDATHGNPFVRGVDGFFADHYVSAGQVIESPHTSPQPNYGPHDEAKRNELIAAIAKIYA